MEPKILKTETDYNEAIAFIEELGDDPNFENDEALIEKFNLFAKLITDYEKEHFHIKAGDPIEIIKLKMNLLGLTRKDLEQFIGSKGTVSDVLNRKRALSKNMIRNLAQGLKIDEAILLSEYELSSENSPKKIDTDTIRCFNFSSEELKVISRFRNQVKSKGMLLNVCP
jgi:HTH-type transcriptional regulator / antitoxin HigA